MKKKNQKEKSREEKEPNQIVPAPVFDDIQIGGTRELKERVFSGDSADYGNIKQWHM